MAPQNLHDAQPVDDTAPADAEGTPPVAPARAAHRATRGGRRRAPAPRSRVAYALGIATVCTVALVELMAGSPATATPEADLTSAAVADALGVQAGAVDQPVVEDPRLLEQLAASRSDRDADEAAAAASQAQSEQAAAAARAEAEAQAAAQAAAAAAAAAAAESAAAAAAAAPSAATAIATISNSAGSVRPQAQAAANAVVSNVPGSDGITIGGTRSSAADPHGHPSGLALDYMVGSDAGLGDAIVAYHLAHWDELGVEYIIWQQRMLSSPGGSWKQMENRGSPTANHMDHPHVNYRG